MQPQIFQPDQLINSKPKSLTNVHKYATTGISPIYPPSVRVPVNQPQVLPPSAYPWQVSPNSFKSQTSGPSPSPHHHHHRHGSLNFLVQQ